MKTLSLAFLFISLSYFDPPSLHDKNNFLSLKGFFTQSHKLYILYNPFIRSFIHLLFPVRLKLYFMNIHGKELSIYLLPEGKLQNAGYPSPLNHVPFLISKLLETQLPD